MESQACCSTRNTSGYRQRPATEGGVCRSTSQPPRMSSALYHDGRVGRNELVPKSITGYSGYIPGVAAENVFGSTFNIAKEKAMVACTVRDQFHQPLFARGPAHLPPLEKSGPRHHGQLGITGPSRIADSTTGYTGHVPSKKAENVVGDTFTRANRAAYENLRDRAVAATRSPDHYPYLGSTGCSYHNTNTGFYPPSAQRPAWVPSNDFATRSNGGDNMRPSAFRLWNNRHANCCSQLKR